MSDCIFCKIRDGQVPARAVHRDEQCMAIEDINPQAPTHLLVIPLEHIPTVNDLTVDHRALVGHLYLTAAKLARQRGIADNGYRLVMNTHRDAGQTVFHIHLHVLGGRPLEWPPG
ncbi:histidine triad nucleotide-binding protein [Archangium lipolyticum]|uniref:histidine triad nucleotide-binding protein n=1 Tax=Archangium lipolyticum TaxID=2970465 RepID=UPI002149A530|nr:histidine triad nucleotide-binding protein [Archangium lipolyticum]